MNRGTTGSCPVPYARAARRGIDIHLHVDTDKTQLLLDILAEVKIVAGGGQLQGGQPFAIGITGLCQQSTGLVGVVFVDGLFGRSRQSAGDEAVDARLTHVVAQVFHHLASVEPHIYGLTNLSFGEGRGRR